MYERVVMNNAAKKLDDLFWRLERDIDTRLTADDLRLLEAIDLDLEAIFNRLEAAGYKVIRTTP